MAQMAATMGSTAGTSAGVAGRTRMGVMAQPERTLSQQWCGMPVDPSILLKYEEPPPDPPKPIGALPALTVAVAGTVTLAAAAWACSGHLGAAKVFASVALGACLINLALVVAQGWNEDGAVGVLYRLRHPLGTVWNADDRHNSCMSLARWWLVGALMASVVYLSASTPGLGKWLNPARSRGPGAAAAP